MTDAPGSRPGHARSAPVPAAFLGVWQRTLLEGPGIASDTRSQVFWLQTSRWHGDVRLPPQRPDFSGCGSLADTSAAQRHWLAGQKGFAGRTEISTASDGTVYCQWHRLVDFQPTRPDRDYGRIAFHEGGAALDEFGVDTQYREHWRRLPQSVGGTAAWRRGGVGESLVNGGVAGFGELLLVAGNCFFYLRDRPLALPPVGTLADAIVGDPALLDMELCVGQWEGASGTITHSTLPWHEGETIAVGAGWRAAA